jgi:hypothetical protein
MALQQRDNNGGKGAVFYRINGKEGCFMEGSGEQKKKYGAGEVDLTGTLLGFKIDPGTDPQGKKKEEIRLIFADPQGGQNMHVSMTIDSEVNGPAGFALKVLAKLNAADLTKPIVLRPWFMPAGTKLKGEGGKEEATAKDSVGVAVYQDGKQVREDFGNGVTKLPECPSQVFAGKTLYDKSVWTPVLDSLLESLHGKTSPTPAADDHVDADGAAEAAEAAAAQQSQQQPNNFRSRATAPTA